MDHLADRDLEGVSQSGGRSAFRDFIADWRRWSPLERITATLFLATVTFGVACVYLSLTHRTLG